MWKWGLGLLLGVALLGAGLLYGAWPAGLQLAGLGWGQAQRLVYRQGDCTLAEAKALRLEGLFPLALSAAELSLHTCPATGNASLPRLPAGHIKLPSVRYGDWPAFSLELQSTGERVQARLGYQQSQLALDWQPASGELNLHGRLTDLAPSKGEVTLEGQGLFDGRLRRLEVLASSPSLLLAGQQLALHAKGDFDGERWQLVAASDGPLQLARELNANWQLQAEGSPQALDWARLEGQLSTPLGPLLLEAKARDLTQAELQLSGQDLKAQALLTRDQLRLEAAELQRSGLTLSLSRPALIPLAAGGQVPLALVGRYQQMELAVAARLHWQGGSLGLDGKGQLQGTWQGQRLGGELPFMLDDQGLTLAPFQLALAGSYGKGQLSNKASQRFDFQAPALALELDWQYQKASFQGQLSLARAADGWVGGLNGASSPLLDKGGHLRLTSAFRLSPEPMLLAGSALALEQGLWQDRLLLPVKATLSQPLLLPELKGALAVQGQGLLWADGKVPPWQGELHLDGSQGQWRLAVPAWQGALAGKLAETKGHWHGDLKGELALGPGLSQALPLDLAGGRLALAGNWSWPEPRLDAKLHLEGAKGYWQASRFAGLDGDLALGWNGGLKVKGPLKLAELDIGTPVRDLEARIDYQDDRLALTGLAAKALGGTLSAPLLSWPSAEPQPVEVKGLALADLAALQAKPVVALGGQLDGTVPLQLEKDGISVVGARLHSSGPASIQVLAVDSVNNLKASNGGVKVALDALGNLAVDKLTADFDMAKDGEARLAVTLEGRNPGKDDLPVKLHYSHQENLRQLLRSLRIGDEVAQKVQSEMKKQGGKP
ncbi:YdbH domain-containing protein [Gallaecimonas kandeliae]|uniref:intermembrane phospholipid transport protein YdbH family protein n=1 Tax=Gallaecimonas kandeliae TaxID=3029055 RepID=UPI002649BF2A|nr:YdbH domain-containing protein [Gallaecimonas kandeliae]WKE64870.1 YdbH domain-containing protein [Gallaecimonas kandeliae]